MREHDPTSKRILRFSETMLIAAAGGALAGLPGLPAGWLIGSFVAVMVAALAGRPLTVPEPIGQVIFVLLGILLGATVTPDSLRLMGTWPLSLLLLTIAMAIVTATVALYLRFFHNWDTLSALFASAPGALSQALALAASTGANVRSVAMVQAVRLLVFTVGLPLAVALGGQGNFQGTAASAPWLSSWPELLVLVVFCSAVAALAHHWRVPGGLIVGSMLASGTAHGSGLIQVNLPPAVAIACFVALGAMIGVRFCGIDMRSLKQMAGAALGALCVGTTLAFGFAFLAAWVLSLRLGDTFLAYVPGGLEAMTILAFALQLDPAFVGAHHLARYILLAFSLPIVAAWIGRTDDSQK